MTISSVSSYQTSIRKKHILKEHIVIGFKYYSRNPVSWLFSVIMPVLFITMFSAINSSGMEHRSTVAILETDKLQDISFNRLGYKILPVSSNVEIMQTVVSGKADFAITRDEAGKIEVLYTQLSYLNAADFILQAKREDFKEADTHRLIQVERDNSQYAFLAGIFVLAIVQVAMYSTATRVMQDKNTGLYRLFAAHRRASFYMLFGELVSKSMIIFLQSLLLLIICLYLFPIVLTVEAIAAYIAVMVIGGGVLIILGYAIGMALAPLKNGVHFVTVINLILLFFGNVMFPSSQFTYTQHIAELLPTTPMVELLSMRVFMKSYDSSFYINIVSLIGWLVIGLALIGLMENYKRHVK